jgi:hypothetical protein
MTAFQKIHDGLTDALAHARGLSPENAALVERIGTSGLRPTAIGFATLNRLLDAARAEGREKQREDQARQDSLDRWGP